MDPSRTICQITDSFSETNKPSKVKTYKNVPDVTRSPRAVRNRMIENGRDYQNVMIERSDIILPEKVANPLKNSSKVFTDLDMILANIDGVYNLTGQEDGYIAPQYIKDFDFASLDVHPFGINYLQYRLPASRGFVPCSSNIEAFDNRLINKKCEKESMTDFVLAHVPEGMDLVVSSNNFKEDLITALQICKAGGHFVSRVDKFDLILFYITAMSFKEFSLFQPIAEDLNSGYFYVIGQEFLGNSIDWVNLLEEGNVEISIPADFLSYVFNFNISLNNLKKDLSENPVQYNPYKCKAIWNIF